ncbi:hypothetical protein Y032_0029g1898 [Ancylostoma ceylanicum]|uniref:Reverse transcriptase domain-containing protein n=1 Tax=Ancylostoma ceylanicum TaxID=53326 RepID=A0A016URJ3_9BILA|nr:hypothetical protein Y032_0029g1898 [Ancylostoma ceylanicum]
MDERNENQSARKETSVIHVPRSRNNWRLYLVAKKAAKKAVAATKAAHYDNISKQLDAKDGGVRLIYRPARSRQRQTEDVEKFYGVNDERGRLIIDCKKATKSWCGHFEEISTEELSHPPIPQLPPTCGPIQPITVEETMAALKRMKPGKATGPDDVAAELWSSRLCNSAEWLTAFFNKVVAGKKTPVDWQRSTIIPIWKRKGNPADCANYWPIHLLSYSMKIFERIIDRRVRDIIRVPTNQCGFVPNCGTTDAIYAAPLLIEKHRVKQKPLHLAFLDLEKAFDRVPHTLRWDGVPEDDVAARSPSLNGSGFSMLTQ